MQQAQTDRLKKFSLSLVTLAIATMPFALLGWPGDSPEAKPRDKDPLATFSSVLATVKNHAYRDLEPEELINSAIDGMLATLDPHTHYLPPDNYENMRAEQTGSFFGIGISFVLRQGLITVISPIEGTPAFAAGIRAGDQIVKIEGESAEGIPQMDVVRKLRGEKGSKVRISIKRQGVEELLDFELARDVIPLNSMSSSYMRDDHIGYVKINHFSKTTSRELDDALRELEGQNMEGLILDLRSNPGGLLDAAWKVVDRFLPEGEIIVSTDGRVDDSDFTFKAVHTFPERNYPIVVLVDRGSASASEIVAGALQDWDRALIVGLPTFGKGLVQRLIPLGRRGENGALQLTTAEYFTPSKRNIQRPYSAYKEHLYAMIGVPSPMSEKGEQSFKTQGGREMEGGGGITPDKEVEYERSSLTFSRLLSRAAFFNFVVQYVNAHPKLTESPEIQDAFLKDFRAYVDEAEIQVNEEDWEADREHIRFQLLAEFANALGGPAERRKIINEDDVMVRTAVELMPEARELLKLGKTAQKK